MCLFKVKCHQAFCNYNGLAVKFWNVVKMFLTIRFRPGKYLMLQTYLPKVGRQEIQYAYWLGLPALHISSELDYPPRF